MALPQVISRNLAQVIGVNTTASGASIVLGTTSLTLYTVPTGKTALITSLLSRVTGMGTNTAIQILVNSISVKRVTAIEDLATENAGGGIRITAAQTIVFIGNNAADDGAGQWLITIKEFDA